MVLGFRAVEVPVSGPQASKVGLENFRELLTLGFWIWSVSRRAKDAFRSIDVKGSADIICDLWRSGGGQT
ncbi:MAG: hypothetical protein Q9198_007188 [Flavoplaca austrocitrina]